MKNKKGFTLLELLAVIVILAIIALIAVPIILNMIENARKGAAKDSAYGYIEAVENYQAYEMLKGNDGLKEGIYNITENTTIGDTKYKKLTDLIKVKGKNPSFGKIGITKNGTVGTADMCVNEYPIRYENNKIEVLDGDCEDLGITLVYNISSEEWEASKTLEIMYPEGKYEYYYKLESGKAKVGEKELVIGEEIKVETNTVTMELLENSKITAWIVKNGKKISLRTYEETKIDKVEIGVPKAEVAIGPLITEYEIKESSDLTITYEEQEGTSAQYSVDGGEWKNYIGPISVSGSKIQARLVRNESGRSGEIVDAIVSNSFTDKEIVEKSYDNDENTALSGSLLSNKNVYFRISDDMKGKKIKIKWRDNNSSDTIYHVFLDKNKNEISDSKVTLSNLTTVNQEYVIPDNGEFLLFYVGKSCEVYEITPPNIIKIEIIEGESNYPTITSSGIVPATVKIEIKSNSNNIKYKINDGEYKKYESGFITVNAGDKILAEATGPTGSTKKAEYTAIGLANAIGSNAYDDDPTSFYLAGNRATRYIYFDESVWGKTLVVESTGYQALIFRDAIGGNKIKDMGDFRTTTNRFILPTGAYVMDYYFNESGGIYNMYLED